MILLLVQYILKAAIKDKILISFLLLLVVSVSLSIFFGAASISEKEQFSLVFAAGSFRLGAMLTLVLFTVFYVRKAFETRDVEYMLSRPITRTQFLLGHSLAFLILAFVMTLLVSTTLFLMPLKADLSGVYIWCFSLFMELAIVANVALFFSFVLNSAVAASLMSVLFYVFARMIGGILGIIATQPETGIMAVAEKVMLLISIVIPRFDLLGQGSWLLYGLPEQGDWLFVVGQGSVFLGLIFMATLIDFKRKQF